MPVPTVHVARERDGAPAVAVVPSNAGLEEAVRAGGGSVVDVADAEALVWAVPHDPDRLARLVAAHPAIRWVQLPFAGVDAFAGVLDDERAWTSAKGVYAEPVAELALTLALATRREVARYATADSWGSDHGEMLFGARVAVLGGGGITEVLLDLLAPFGCDTTVVRTSTTPVAGHEDVAVVAFDDRHRGLRGADVVVLALALTDETEGVVDAAALDLLADGAVVVNVARGRHVVTDDLVAALRTGRLGGAGLDVTDPEPLPDGHALWTMSNVVITPHVGNTRAMGRRMLAAFLTDNVARWAAGDPVHGAVSVDAGY